MYCPKCNYSLSPKDLGCPRCGHRFKPAPPVTVVNNVSVTTPTSNAAQTGLFAFLGAWLGAHMLILGGVGAHGCGCCGCALFLLVLFVLAMAGMPHPPH